MLVVVRVVVLVVVTVYIVVAVVFVVVGPRNLNLKFRQNVDSNN